MNQLTHRKQRSTVQSYLKFSFLTYIFYAALHFEAVVAYFEDSKLYSGFNLIFGSIYCFTCYKTYISSKTFGEPTLDYPRIKKSLDFAFTFNKIGIVAGAVGAVIAIILKSFTWFEGVYFFEYALILFIIISGIFLCYPVPFCVMVFVKQKEAKEAIEVLEEAGNYQGDEYKSQWGKGDEEEKKVGIRGSMHEHYPDAPQSDQPLSSEQSTGSDF